MLNDTKLKNENQNTLGPIMFHVKGIVNHYRDRERKLFIMLYERGVSQTEIAKAFGCTRQAISLIHPKSIMKEVKS